MKKLAVLILSVFLCTGVFAHTAEGLHASMLENNPGIRGARDEVSKALLDVKDAKAGYAPTLDLTVAGSYIANPIDPIRINIGDYIDISAYGTGNDYITLYKGQENWFYTFQLELTQPLFTWGKLEKAVKIYSEVYNARILQLEDAIEKAETELNTRLAVLYYLLETDVLLNEQQILAQRLVELADSAFQNGMMLKTDALNVKVQASRINVARAQVRQQITLMETEISNLTGIEDFSAANLEYTEGDFRRAFDAVMETEFSDMRTEALSMRRTNLALLNVLSVIAGYTKDVANASVNWKPDVALVLDAGYAGSRLPFIEKDWYGQDDWNATVTVALKTTVLDGGKAVRDVRRNTLAVEQSEIDIEDARAKILSSLAENSTALEVCAAQLEYKEAQKEQLEEKAEVQKNLFETGYGSEADYLQTLIDCNTCEIEMLESRIGAAQNVYTLLYLAGRSADF